MAMLKEISKTIVLSCVVSFIILTIIEKCLKSLSIDFLFYLKWGIVIYIFMIFLIIITFVIEFMLFKYVCNHKDLNISNKLPVKLQDHLLLCKTISQSKINSLKFENLYYEFFILYGFLFFTTVIFLLLL